uniref:Solute carrier family 23 member 2 n=1 Tax=Caenorhabditis tropicalis TaxID=1561998 RepID=A0A1I7UNL8_9PELO
MLVCISALLVTPYLLSNMLCAGAETIAIRVQLIAATFITTGIATILQSTFGLRLAILHGPSFAFLPALHTFEDMYPCSPDTDTSLWKEKMQLISGSLFIAVLIMPLMGITGLVGKISKHIGPITIVPMLVLLCIGTVPDIQEKVSLHWISIVEILLLIVFVILLEDFEVPIPVFSFKKRHVSFTKLRIFSQFPYLLGISVAWFLCWLVTVTNIEPIGSPARTDLNASVFVFENTPWIHIQYPFQFGFPQLSAPLIIAFTASTVAVMIESVGNYGICAQISQQGTPPSSSINRAFVIEGIGSMLAALMGCGTGVTTYSENIALMQVTKVTSRITMQCAGLLLIIIGVFSKFAAFLAMIPEAIIGGVLATGMSMICGVAFANLQNVDLRLSRNLTIVGISIILGCTIPTHFEKNPLNTGNKTIDESVGTLLKMRMLVGGIIAFLLDVIACGATRKQRGLKGKMKEKEEISVERDGFALSSDTFKR